MCLIENYWIHSGSFGSIRDSLPIHSRQTTCAIRMIIGEKATEREGDGDGDRQTNRETERDRVKYRDIDRQKEGET